MNDSEIQLIANQVAANSRQLIIDEIDRRLRKPSGVVSGGPYSSFSVNDQGQVIAASGGGSVARFFDTTITGAAITNLTTVEYIFSREHNSDGTLASDTWFDASTPVRIIVPTTGIFETIVVPFWVVDNTTGDRTLEIDQARGGSGWDSVSVAWPSKKTTAYGSTPYPTITYRWNVIAGDEFRMYVGHNGGVNTLKCRLDCWFQQL